MAVLAVDVGGTKLAAGVVDDGGRLVAAERIPTPQPVDAEGLWRTLEALADRVLGGLPVAGVGIGCGGPMTWPEGEVSPLNIPAWRAFPLRERFVKKFPGVPVRLHNDAICVAVAEHWRGAGRGSSNLLGMVVSTGVGGGLVLGGRLIDGASGNAGHIGHVVVEPDGVPCKCGGRGCLEAVARGPAVVAWAQSQGWRTGSTGVTARELVDDASREHPIALAAMNRAGRALGVAIASAAHLCDLDVVAIGGGLSQAGPLLFRPLEEAYRAHACMEYAKGLRVVPAMLGQEAGLIGAAALVLAGPRYWSAD
ncbi:ROK family protein [Bailinhaonella thermotolerans]|uniref:ROK family protein n=1 Tax=Bailinhaonella thermotolerans TaxID=1070861 RepID=A0A3A4BFQ8_9ACTN|nr:ROK family protein [Bailinhaonella thermotolerans]RJL33322.1 ROK family protein [Bailinhaonella thermotolerans]